MFKFNFPFNDDLSKLTLLFPSVSIGHIGQLTTDLLITNLKAKKIGSVFHSALEPIAANDEDSLITSCQIFKSEEKKMIIVQFHAPVSKNGGQEFAQFLLGWGQMFGAVICLGSIGASSRLDGQLVGSPLRFLASSAFEKKQQLETLGWRELEKKEDLTAAGLTEIYYKIAEAMSIPFLALCLFASEGDNSINALYLLHCVNELLNLFPKMEIDPEDSFWPLAARNSVRVPASWKGLHGGSAPPIY